MENTMTKEKMMKAIERFNVGESEIVDVFKNDQEIGTIFASSGVKIRYDEDELYEGHSIKLVKNELTIMWLHCDYIKLLRSEIE